MLFVGDDWAQDSHQICLEDQDGNLLLNTKVPEGINGIARVHEAVGRFETDPSQVVIGIETEHGLLVSALLGAGYQVYAINPLSAARYRERHSVSGAKSDPGDARVLAEIVRLDRTHHRLIAGDSEAAAVIKVLARQHQNLVWSRQTQINVLRSTLREFYPAALSAFGADLGHGDCLSVLAVACEPCQAAELSVADIMTCLKRGGRKRNVERRAVCIHQSLQTPHLTATPLLARSYGTAIGVQVAILQEVNKQIRALEAELSSHFEKHPDAKIITSLPGLGVVLGARVLGEFGDDPDRYQSAKSRKNYAGTSPITKASGTRRAVMSRVARNKRTADATYLWAFAALNCSPGARAYYDTLRARNKTHNQALRAVANRLVGILHGCLRHRCLYEECKAWPSKQTQKAA